MIFLDDQCSKMYRTNELWYRRVGNGTALIDTIKTPSICATGYNDNDYRVPYHQVVTPPLDSIDSDVIDTIASPANSNILNTNRIANMINHRSTAQA